MKIISRRHSDGNVVWKFLVSVGGRRHRKLLGTLKFVVQDPY